MNHWRLDSRLGGHATRPWLYVQKYGLRLLVYKRIRKFWAWLQTLDYYKLKNGQKCKILFELSAPVLVPDIFLEWVHEPGAKHLRRLFYFRLNRVLPVLSRRFRRHNSLPGTFNLATRNFVDRYSNLLPKFNDIFLACFGEFGVFPSCQSFQDWPLGCASLSELPGLAAWVCWDVIFITQPLAYFFFLSARKQA